MSPELFDPEAFNLKDSRQTKYSDCYALGMVIYEVLSGQLPFFRHHGYAVVVKILKGERPGRPQGVEGRWFTDEIWSTLEHCWKPNPGDRPSIKWVLHCLEEGSRSWTPPEKLAYLPETNTPAYNSNQSAEESTDESGTSPPSQTVSSQPSWRLPLKGDLNGDGRSPSAHEFSALPCGAPGCQGLGTSTVKPDGLDSGESIEILDKVSWAVSLSSFWYLFGDPLGTIYQSSLSEESTQTAAYL